MRLAPASTVHLLRDVRWADRLQGPREPLDVRVGGTVTFAGMEDFAAFGPGWWLPDPSGIWTHGRRAVLTLALRVPAWTRPVIELTFDRVGVRRGRPVRIGLVIDGTRVDTRVLTGGGAARTRLTRWRAGVPRQALAKRVFDIAVEVEDPVEWADANRLGLHLRALGVRTGLVPIPLRERLDEAADRLNRLMSRLRHAVSRSGRRRALLLVSRRGATRP